MITHSYNKLINLSTTYLTYYLPSLPGLIKSNLHSLDY
jgi:hypothetical protein